MKMRYAASLLIATALWSGECVPNHLEGTASPYLRQHLCNPVDWYPWGEAAFKKARREHKPIFLSIGYSTCHWCHVMARESFENPEIAELINRWFVPVKVDRERMPHLDRYFQRLYAAVRGRSGGWPLNVFLTEDRRPFFLATYLPPEDGYGAEGLRTLLPRFGKLYRKDRQRIERMADAVEKLAAKKRDSRPKVEGDISTLVNRVTAALAARYDRVRGGWGTRPKFPESAKIRLLFDLWRLGSHEAREMAQKSLEAMASGGLYDQVEGGFFRYCVDRGWRTPHFEKMLYTNAELIDLYTRAWRLWRKPLYRRIVRESIEAIDRRFRSEEGLYFSASDAESDHMEGGYYLFRYDEALAAMRRNGLKGQEAEEILAYLDIEKEGNFDTEYAHVRRTNPKPPPRLERGLEALRALRKGRSFPFIDKKVIASWNGMMIEALFRAAAIEDRYLAAAEASFRAVTDYLGRRDGRIAHQALYPDAPEGDGLLEDYAFMAAAALAGYEATLDERYLQTATRWSEIAVARFYEAHSGRWYLSDGDLKPEADLSDRYHTSALSKMLSVLQTMALLQSDPEPDRIVARTLARYRPLADPDQESEAVRLLLRRKRGMAVIKASKARLRQLMSKKESLPYPFVYFKAEAIEGFEACDMRGCFAFADSPRQLKEALKKR